MPKYQVDESNEKLLLIQRLYGEYYSDDIKDAARLLGVTMPSPMEVYRSQHGYYPADAGRKLAQDMSGTMRFEDAETILKKIPPSAKREGYQLRIPFRGYFITVKRNWNVKLGSEWDLIRPELQNVLGRVEKSWGLKSYAILKAFLQAGYHEEHPHKIMADADRVLGMRPGLNVWYNHFNDLMGIDIVFDTGSNKNPRRMLLPELFPLAEQEVERYESKGVHIQGALLKTSTTAKS